jgi:hypothetical protein
MPGWRRHLGTSTIASPPSPPDRLADHVQCLPDDDERLVRLAAAFPENWNLADLPVGENLRLRCASFGRGSGPATTLTSSSATTLRPSYRPWRGYGGSPASRMPTGDNLDTGQRQ